MLEQISVKIKKSKKEKKEKREAREEFEHFEGDAVEEIVEIHSKKEKKEKKMKRASMLDDEPLNSSSCKSVNTDAEIIKDKKDRKKKRESIVKEEVVVIEEAEEISDSTLQPKKKKDKKTKKESPVSDGEAVSETVNTLEETPKKKKSKHDKDLQVVEKPIGHDANVCISTPIGSYHDYDETTGGAKYWRRIDVDKYQDVVTGTKFEDNSHYAKGGDSWGDDAADRLGKVKGKGFKKEMQKLKRASWKGCGSIDTGVNSVQFSDWEE